MAKMKYTSLSTENQAIADASRRTFSDRLPQNKKRKDIDRDDDTAAPPAKRRSTQAAAGERKGLSQNNKRKDADRDEDDDTSPPPAKRRSTQGTAGVRKDESLRQLKGRTRRSLRWLRRRTMRKRWMSQERLRFPTARKRGRERMKMLARYNLPTEQVRLCTSTR